MEDIGKVLRSILDRKGCHYDGAITTKSILITMIPLLFLVECVLSMVYRWADLNRRFLAMEDINLCLAALFVHYDITYMRNDMKSIMKILEDRCVMSGEATTKIYEEQISRQMKLINVVVVVLQINLTALPFMKTIYEMFLNFGSYKNGSLNVSDLYLPFEFYHAVYIDFTGLNFIFRIVLFFILNLFHVFFVTIIADSGKIMYVTFFGPIKLIIYEMRSLGESIKRIDSEYLSGMNDEFIRYREDKLRNHMSNIVSQHVKVCSKLFATNKSVRVIAQTVFQCSCFQICLLFYWISEVDETIALKSYDFIHVLSVSIYAYLYSSIGQEIINEDEILRTMLYNCSWIDKPNWFKKSLLLIITRTNRRLEVKPYGFYIIGLSYFATIMNAAYSYYNLLSSTK